MAIPAELIALFDKEFGKQKPKPKAKHSPVSPLAPAKRSPVTTSDKLELLCKTTSVWKPVSRIYYTTQQICSCCGSSVEFLGNSLIRHQHSKDPSRFWDFPLPERPSHSLLPCEIVDYQQTVPACPHCLRLEFFFCVYPSDSVRQLSLFSSGASHDQ